MVLSVSESLVMVNATPAEITAYEKAAGGRRGWEGMTEQMKKREFEVLASLK